MKRYILATTILSAVTVLIACNKKNDIGPGDGGGTVYVDLPQTAFRYYNDSANGRFNAKATLGRVLFYDARLSVNNAISCASCHKQSAAFADDVALSRGFENKLTHRNSPALQNLTNTTMGMVDPIRNIENLSVGMFWDGREKNLLTLITKPIANHIEMGVDDVSTLPARIKGQPYYKTLFTNAFGAETITVDRISESIVYFLASIRSDSSRFDKFNARQITLSALELQGQMLFTSKYNCDNCHNTNPGGYMSSGFRDIGLDKEYTDLGFGAVVNASASNGKFKTPNLRNVALTAPYMHDGRFKTLEEVLEHYSEGINNSPNLDMNLKDFSTGEPMKMNISDQEKTALVAFLNTLTDNTMTTDIRFSDPFKVK